MVRSGQKELHLNEKTVWGGQPYRNDNTLEEQKYEKIYTMLGCSVVVYCNYSSEFSCKGEIKF